MVTHNIDEALEMADRVVVFGKPARVLADIKLGGVSGKDKDFLRRRMQEMIDKNKPVDAR